MDPGSWHPGLSGTLGAKGSGARFSFSGLRGFCACPYRNENLKTERNQNTQVVENERFLISTGQNNVRIVGIRCLLLKRRQTDRQI